MRYFQPPQFNTNNNTCIIFIALGGITKSILSLWTEIKYGARYFPVVELKHLHYCTLIKKIRHIQINCIKAARSNGLVFVLLKLFFFSFRYNRKRLEPPLKFLLLGRTSIQHLYFIALQNQRQKRVTTKKKKKKGGTTAAFKKNKK